MLNFGESVSGVGDVNGDGFADVIVGASGCWNGQDEWDEGAVYLFQGSASGLSGTDPAGAAALLESNQADAHLGSSVAGVGDVDGDGYADVIVGAPSFDNGEETEGAAFLFLGSSVGLQGSDPSTAASILESNQARAAMGSSVSGAGDVNGDGFADVIVGAPGYDNGEMQEGAAFVFLGSASGLVGTNPAEAAALLESNQAENSDDVLQSGPQFGSSVAGAGDVNGDGYADVIVGAGGKNYEPDGFDKGEANEGAAFLFLG